MLRIELPMGCVDEIVRGAKWFMVLHAVVRSPRAERVGRLDAGSVLRTGAGVGQAHAEEPQGSRVGGAAGGWSEMGTL